MSDLWAMHIPGPDDIYAAPSKEAAEHMAKLHNASMDAFFEKHPRTQDDPSKVCVTAVVVPWPFGAEDHAEAILVFDYKSWGLEGGAA